MAGLRTLTGRIGLVAFALAIVWALTLSRPATAAEPICPGGSSPRADIAVCYQYDALSSCVTGYENACWLANGYQAGERPPNLPGEGWQIVSASEGFGPAVGTGFVTSRPMPGSSGTGYGTINVVPGANWPQLQAAWRYYVRYRGGYLGLDSAHGAGLDTFRWSGTPWLSGCQMSPRLQASNFSGFVYASGAPCANGIAGVYNAAGSPTAVGNVTEGFFNINAGGEWFFALTAVNTSAQESVFSIELQAKFVTPFPAVRGA
jgi:hypothetical protein